MKLADLKELVSAGESQTLEFKRKINFPEKVVREMVAFANSGGGRLLVGVDDSGDIPGLRDPAEHDFALRKAVSELCIPKFKFDGEVIPLNKKKSVLCYRITSDGKPHYAKDVADDQYGRAYIRVNDQTLKASREMTQILKRRSSTRNYVFNYGEKEALLMKMLDSKEVITLEEYKEEARIPRRVASASLVLLVLAGVLQIMPGEREDLFKVKNI